jgi:hypothetical protein
LGKAPKKGGKMTNKKLAKILKSAIENGDIDAVWFVIGELEKGKN